LGRLPAFGRSKSIAADECAALVALPDAGNDLVLPDDVFPSLVPKLFRELHGLFPGCFPPVSGAADCLNAGERGTLVHEGAMPLIVLHADGQSETPKLGSGDPVDSFAMEIQAAVDGATSGKMPDVLSGQLARYALVMCLRECDSVRSGTAVVIS
jgi:hypothetical protein